MAEGKYGRLFTEQDVTRLIAAARTVGPFSPDEHVSQWARDCLAAYDGDFPADEPLFLLRGQDVYAPWGAQHYVDAVSYGRRASVTWPEHLKGVLVSEGHFQAAHQAWQALLHFQRANPDRVKVPD